MLSPTHQTCIALACLAILGACTRPDEGPPLATQPTVAQAVGAVASNRIVVDFAPGGATLAPDAQAQLDVAARLFRDVNPVAMFAIGTSDPTGDEFANIVLSARRALVVKRALIARGIPADRLRIQALGASDPPNTQDLAAPENRRVVVQWRLL